MKKSRTSSNIIMKGKNMLFKTFNRVLKSKIVGLKLGYFLLVLQFTQLISLLVSTKNELLAQLFGNAINYTNYTRIHSFIVNGSSIASYLFFGFVIAIVLLFLWVIFGFFKIHSLNDIEEKKYEKFKYYYGLTLDLIDTVLLFPIAGIVASGFYCDYNTENIPECFGVMHLIRSGIGLILGAVTGIIILTIALFFFNFGFKSKDCLTRSPSLTHFFFRIYILVLITLDVIISEENFIIIIGMHTFFSLAFCVDYYLRLPYYNVKISEFYCLIVYSYFWISVNLFVATLYKEPLIQDNILYIILVGFLFFLYIVRTIRDSFFMSLLSKNTDDINNEVHLDVRFRYLV